MRKIDSFYGGKQGDSFILKASFESVNDMVTAFKRGSNYTDVWYGEHCLIDTPNKNDKDNGKIYKRGLDYQNSVGGAIYVGQIVGPSSGTPYFQLNTIKEVTDKSEIELEDYEYRRFPTGYQMDDEGRVIGYETSDGSDGKNIAVFPFSKAHDTSIVPGKYVEDGATKYNDEIRWTWVNIRKDNADADSWFYVGFEIPYPVIDYSIHMTSPYDTSGNILSDATDISRIDDQTHPFYAHWDLGLPKGVKGDTLRNLRVIVPNSGNRTNIYDPSAITVNPTTGEATVGQPGYDGIDDDIAASRQIIVYDYYIYDKLRNPSAIMIYLGDFNIITDISLDDEGTLTLEYTHEDDSVFTKKIRWVDNIALTEGNGNQGGHFTFTFNNDTPFATREFDVSWIKGIEILIDGSLQYTYAGTPESLPADATRISEGVYRVEDFLQWLSKVELDPETGVFTVTNNRGEEIFRTELDWIKDIDLDEFGTVTLHHTKGDTDETLSNHIKWINDVSLNPNTGLFRIVFNYGEPVEFQLNWVDDVYINEENGNIYIHNTNSVLNREYDDYTGELLDAKLKLITRASVSATGIITLHTNTGETIQLNQEGSGSAQPFQIKVIENVTLNTGILEDKRIFVKYNTETQSTPIGDPINHIKDMVVRTTDWHLLVLYTDPQHRYPNTGGSLDDEGTDQNGIRWVSGILGSDGTNYETGGSPVYWRDMGAIKDQSGILVGFNVDHTEVQGAGFDPNIAGTPGGLAGEGGTGVCGYLQKNYPSGLTGEQNSTYTNSYAAKIVTYNPPPTGENLDKQDKEFYAYDYLTYRWYYLGKIADSGMRDAKLLESAQVNASNLSSLSTNGLLFTAIPSTISNSAMPKYWDITYNSWV